MEMGEKRVEGTAEMRDKKGSEEIERGMVQDGRDTLVRRETCGKIVWTTGMLMRQYESHWLQQQLRMDRLAACGRTRDEGRGQSETGACQKDRNWKVIKIIALHPLLYPSYSWMKEKSSKNLLNFTKSCINQFDIHKRYCTSEIWSPRSSLT